MEKNEIYHNMVESNRKRSVEKEYSAISAIKNMLSNKIEVTIAGLVRETGLSRAFFYNNERIHAAYMEAREHQKGQDLNAQKRKVLDKAMMGKINMLEEQLTIRNEECKKLKAENERMKGIINTRNLKNFEDL